MECSVWRCYIFFLIMIIFMCEFILVQENTSDGCDNSDTDGTKKHNSKEKCPSCNKRCNNLKTHKCKPINTLPCDIWGKHLLAQSALNSHNKLHIGEKFSCEICNKLFTTKKSYFAHKLMIHDVKPFSCEFCDKKFARKQLLDEHLRIHLDIRPFVCEICEKSFTRKAHLDLHKEGHFPQYKCELCSRVFTRNGQLKEHIRIHTGEKPFKCEACGKEYARKTRLKYHKCEGSEILQDAAKECQSGTDPNFVCEVCNKRFPSEEHLELHKDSHIPRFKCDVCERLFTRKAQLVEHERTHSGDKPFRCEACGKDYTRKIRLKRHSCKPLNAAKKLKTTHFILAE